MIFHNSWTLLDMIQHSHMMISTYTKMLIFFLQKKENVKMINDHVLGLVAFTRNQAQSNAVDQK